MRIAPDALKQKENTFIAAGFQPVYAADLDLGYDANGNVVSKATPSGVTTFSYDPLDRIDLEAGPAGARNHDFDANGNRTTDGAGTTASFTPGTDRIATLNGQTVTLDAAGNLTNDGTYKYLWNGLNQLAELRKPDDTLIASYYYNHQNLRTRKVTTAAAPQGAGKTFYHYDQQGHLIAETTPGNQPQATYIWNGDVLTGYIVHQPQRTVYTVQTDHLGSPFQVRALAGTVVWRWESEAFGKTAPNEDPDGDGVKLTLNLRFPGQYYDRESGLHYNWNRYYSPRLGRYLSPDPIGLSGGLNLYTYISNNPLRWIDPTGLAQVSTGGEASGHAVLVGLGVGGGVTIDDNGTICVYASGSLSFGLGIYAGAGLNVGGSTGSNTTGLSGSGGVFLEGGGGIAAGTEINVGSDGSVGGGKGFGGVGVGGAGGFRQTGTATYCFNQPKDDKGCKK